MTIDSAVKKILMFLLVICFASTSNAQNRDRIKKATKDYDKYSFINAREIYLKVLEAGYSSPQIFEKLADTYYYNGQYQDAAKWYGRLIAEYPDEVSVEYYFRAAQSLKSLGQYSESNDLMELYALNGGNPLIVKKFKENPDYLTSIAFSAKNYEIEEVGINTDASDFGPSFYKDKVVFASSIVGSEGLKIHKWNNQPYTDLYVANIVNEGNLVDAVSLGGDVNTKYHETSPTFTKDGKTMYFTRNNFIDGKKGRDDEKTLHLKIYKANNSGYNTWTNIIELPFNNEDYSVAHPSLAPDEKRLYFSSDMPGSFGMSDLWYVQVNEDGTYGVPVNLGPDINTEAKESFPFVSSRNKLYFSSNGHTGLGGLDVFATQLDSNGNPGEILNLGAPTNGPFDDFGFIFDEEKKFGYVSSNREGGLGSISDDIYLLKKCEVTIAGTVTDLATGELIPDATVELLDENNTKLASTTSDENGRYQFDNVLNCGTIYLVRASGTGCEFLEKVIETPTQSQVMEVPMPLECDPCAPDDLGCRLSLEPIYFDFDRYNIRPDAEIELAKILAALREYPQLIIHIESHTDSRGNDSYNEALSEKRAQSTLDWLVSKEIDRDRLSAKGYGEYQLQNQCSNGVECTEEEHQLNRRSMFIIQN
jgi:outer membrane protein OmpA-like peptidoglycan-associated protein/tetratricopeptide (TPR) repeat protein